MFIRTIHGLIYEVKIGTDVIFTRGNIIFLANDHTNMIQLNLADVDRIY